MVAISKRYLNFSLQHKIYRQAVSPNGRETAKMCLNRVLLTNGAKNINLQVPGTAKPRLSCKSEQ